MNPYERIKKLAKKKGISVRDLGFSNGYFGKWKKVSPNSSGITKVADYFNVSTDYLLGRTELPVQLTADDAFSFLINDKSESLSKQDIYMLKALWKAVLNAYVEQKDKA